MHDSDAGVAMTKAPNKRQIEINTGLIVHKNGDDRINFPNFQKPVPVGFFSINSDRDFIPDASQLRYFKHPSVKSFPLDLNIGLNKAIKKPETSSYVERLDHILMYIFKNSSKFFKPQEEQENGLPLIGSEFVCFRGLLTQIMSTPYDCKEKWSIKVLKWMGTFYMYKCNVENERMKNIEQQKMCAWGFKFEQYCLTADPLRDADTKEAVDECSEFACVFKTKLEGIDLLYVAEMDGIIGDKVLSIENDNFDIGKLKFIELKVSKEHLKPYQKRTFERHKARKWWCQAFLVGIQDIYVGARNDEGLVNNIKYYEVRSLPKLDSNYWRPAKCMMFLIDFLRCLRHVMANVNCPYTVYEFSFNPETQSVSYIHYNGLSEHSFLPDWYIKFLKHKTEFL